MDLQEPRWTSTDGFIWHLNTGSYSATIYPAQQFAGRWTAWVYGPDDFADMTVLATVENARQWCKQRLRQLGASWAAPLTANTYHS